MEKKLMNPIFSVIVPVYKTEKYLDKCVTSILTQSFENLELILVDDGSPDNCPQLCDEYALRDKRVKVIHKENGGVSSARNVGIDAARGQFIWFVDSDDYIEEFALEKLYEEQNKEYADIYIFNVKNSNELFVGTIDDFLRKYYFNYIVGFEPWNKLYRTSVIKNNRLYFDIQETIGEDLLFNLSYYKAVYSVSCEVQFYYIGQDYYAYVDRPGSAMNTASKGRIVQQMRIFDKIVRMLSGTISEVNMAYLFWLHLMSGIGQSARGGLSSREFVRSIDWKRYRFYFNQFKQCQKEFFKNEHASLLGRLRVRLFFATMNVGAYRLAGKVMGL